LKKIAFVLIIAGLIIIAAPYVGTQINERRQKELLIQFDSNWGSVLPSKQTDGSNASSGSTSSGEKIVQNNEKALGKIMISNIELELPILPGVEKASLENGIGYLAESDPLGGIGNAVLAGHRNYPFAEMFRRLDELKIGDRIEIETNDEKYTYVVFQKLVVLPEDLSVLKRIENKKILTLITCAPLGKDTHRLVVQAQLYENTLD